MWSVFVLVGAFYFVKCLIQFVEKSSVPNLYNTNSIPGKGVGWILSASFFIDSILVGVALQRMGDQCVRVGIKIRGALMTAVYRKTFKLANLHGEDAGNVVSLVSTDCIKLYEGVQHFHNVWTAPLEALAIIALLLSLTKGIYGLPALGVVLIVLPLQYWFGIQIAKFKSKTVDVSDQRVLRMHEVLLAIRLVKVYVWEKRFSSQVNNVRAAEVKLMVKSAIIKTFNLCLVFAIPPITAIITFATVAFVEGPFDSTFSFTVLSLFNTLRFPLVVLPKALRGLSGKFAGSLPFLLSICCISADVKNDCVVQEMDPA
jgi:ATP-binding cassette subfamily C (CFTR/MRP) protein 1